MSNIDKHAQGEKTREAFERWAEQSGALPWGILKKHRNQDGTYPGPHYTYMWHAWNACHEALLDELEAKERQNAELAASLKQVVSGYKYLLRTARPEMMIAGNIDIQQAEKLLAAAACKGE